MSLTFKVSEDLDPTKLDRMYNTECPPPGTPLDPTPGSVGSRGLLPYNSCGVVFPLQPPKWISEIWRSFQENTDECEVISHVDHGWTRTRKVIRLLCKLFATQNLWVLFFSAQYFHKQKRDKTSHSWYSFLQNLVSSKSDS